MRLFVKESSECGLEMGTRETNKPHLRYWVEFCSEVGIEVDQFVRFGMSEAESVLEVAYAEVDVLASFAVSVVSLRAQREARATLHHMTSR